jgi:hypothetical protein
MNGARLLEQRCFLLFLSLVFLLFDLAFLTGTAAARLFLGAFDAVVLVLAIAATTRSRLSFLGAVCLAVPVLVFQVLALRSGRAELFAVSWSFAALFTFSQLHTSYTTFCART